MTPSIRSALLTAALLASLAPAAIAQEAAAITGRVTNESGSPLANAVVSIAELSLGATTRQDGRYSIVVPGARITGQQVALTARLISYKAKTVQITLAPGPMTQDFVLAANPLQLGEVVVTGAGTVSETEKLGTVRSNVSGSEIVSSQEPNVINALAAKAPNVTVTSSSGDPGASTFIQVRGLTTITAQDGQPLIVVDGIPVDNTINYNFFSALNSGDAPPNRAIDINPDDIESVEILKGAASAAIYGSRAGQGVILINTKKGKAGPTHYSLRTAMSFDEPSQLPDLQRKFGLGSGGVTPACVSGGAQNCRVGFAEAGSWGPKVAKGTATYDHAGEMFQTGNTYDVGLTISGGNERTTFFLSGAYNYMQGIVVGPSSNFQRVAIRAGGTQEVFSKLNIGANFNYVDSDGQAIVSRNSTDGLALGAWRTTPTFNNLPYLDPTTGLHRSYRFPNPGPGSEQVGRSYDNPFFVANESPGSTETARVYGNLNLTYDATKWLQFAYTLGLDYSNDERTQGWAWTTSNTTVAGVNGVGGVTGGYIKTSQVDNNVTGTATYRVSQSWNGKVTAGANWNAQNFRTRQIVGSGLIAAQPFNLGNTSVQQPPFDFESVVHLQSFFGQVTADLWDQLYLTAAVRNDGASTFGASQQRAWYPKASAAWNFYRGQSGENRWLTYGKVRAAYGQSGTQPQPYLLTSTLTSFTSADGGWGPVITTQQAGVGGLVTNFNLPTSELGPERVGEFETGFDLGLFKDIADLSFTYYVANSSDVILNLPVAGSSGYTEKPANAGKIKNQGFEVALNVRPVTTKDFAWNLGFQWATNKNEVTDLAGVQFVPFPFSGGTNGLGIQGVAINGQPLGVYYASDFVRCGRGLVIGGVDIDNTAGECQGAANGALYIDGTGYPQLDAAGTYVVGDPNPDWIGSARTSFTWKGLSLSGLIDIRQGGVAYNGTAGALDHFGTSQSSVKYRTGGNYTFGRNYFPDQQVAGPGAGMAVPLDEAWFTGAGGVFNGPVSQFMEDPSFVKLREVAIGYTFTQPWVSKYMGFSTLQLLVAGRNLVTWTDYTGVDPETSLLGSATAVRGIDYFNNPQTRSLVVSLTLNR